MAISGDTAARPASATAPLSIEDLTDFCRHAEALEEIFRDASAAIYAIDSGGLLDAAPLDPLDYDKHCCATQLLDLVARRLRAVEAIHGTDLSVKLHVSISAARKGR